MRRSLPDDRDDANRRKWMFLLTVSLIVAPIAPGSGVAGAATGEDTGAPSAVSEVRLETEQYDGLYVNEVPEWAWGQADSGDGIDRYEVLYEDYPADEEHIIEVAADTYSFAPEAPDDGRHCIEVRAVDEDGDAGPWTRAPCAFLDRVDPAHVIDQPRPASLHLDGSEVLDIRTMPAVHADRAYVLGGVDVYLNSTDPGDRASGIEDAYLQEPGDCSEPRACGQARIHHCENSLGPPRVCAWTDEDGDTDEPYVRDLVGVTHDRAANTASSASVTYTKVDVAVVEREVDGATAGVVHWEISDSPNFDRYEVFATRSDGEADPAAIRHVATVTDRGQPSAVDRVPEPGESWVYQVVAFASWGTIVEERTHATELAYAGDPGRVSAPVECPTGYTCANVPELVPHLG